MKKNLSLFIILAVMLGLGYWWEEIYSPLTESKALAKTRIFNNLENIYHIKLEKFSLKKSDGYWTIVEDNHPATPKMINALSDHLSKLHIQSSVEYKDISQFFSQTRIEFEIDDKKFILGNFSSLTGDFYLLDISMSKLYVVRDFSDYEGIYKSEIELFYAKYEILCSRLTAASLYYVERNFARFVPVDDMTNIEITQNNKTTRLDLIKNHFSPNPYPKIPIVNLKQFLHQWWSEITLIGYTPKKNIKKYKEVWALKHRDFYLRLVKEKGYYLFWDHHAWAYEISKETFSKLQWDSKMFFVRSVHWPIDFSNVTNIDFSLSLDQKKWFEFEIKDVQKFKITSKDNYKFSIEGMNFLFHVLFGLADFKSAHDVGAWNSDHLLYKVPGFYIKLWSKLINVKIVANRIILVDLDNAFFWEYQYPSDSVGIKTSSDIFTLLAN